MSKKDQKVAFHRLESSFEMLNRQPSLRLFLVSLSRWTDVSLFVQLNSAPTLANGQIGVWSNGNQVIEEKKMLFRTGSKVVTKTGKGGGSGDNASKRNVQQPFAASTTQVEGQWVDKVSGFPYISSIKILVSDSILLLLLLTLFFFFSRCSSLLSSVELPVILRQLLIPTLTSKTSHFMLELLLPIFQVLTSLIVLKVILLQVLSCLHSLSFPL